MDAKDQELFDQAKQIVFLTGAGVCFNGFGNSGFSQCQWLIYTESQCRILFKPPLF